MKITAVDADGVLDDIVLGDDAAGDLIVDPAPLPAERRGVQAVPLFRGATAFATGRGNRVVSFSWSVAREHASAGAAAEFVRQHASKVPINVGLTVAEGELQSGYTGVMAEVVAVAHFGTATVFGYRLEGAVAGGPETD